MNPRFLLLPVAVPLAAAAIAVLVHRRLTLQRISGFGGGVFVLGAGIVLVARTADGSVVATQVGGWPPGFAIPFAADQLAALMVAVAGLMLVTCTAFAVARREDEHPLFHPLVMVLSAGMAGSFLTADLFNLFVFFEVMLAASYVLLTLRTGRAQLRGGAVYVATNLLGSTILVAGIALTYGVAGTVNMAALSEAVESTGAIAVSGGFLIVAFAVKAALVPVHGWIGKAYPSTSPAVAALFSGLLTKVGVYAMFRVYAVVFDGAPALQPLFLWGASATMALGVLAAVGKEAMRPILSFHIVSQIGYMIMGLGLFGLLGLAGGIFYVIHHIIVKTSLFLSAGAVETLRGSGALERLGGMARQHPLLAVGFILSALSLAGLPPSSGFFAKLTLVRAAFEDAQWGIAAVAVVVSFLTLLSMVKIWNGVFWGRDPDLAPEIEDQARLVVPVSGGAVGVTAMSRGRVAAVIGPAFVLAMIALGVGLFAEGLLTLSTTAAEGLLDPTAYVKAVLGR